MKLLQAALCLSLALLFAVLAWHASETNIKAAVLCAGLALILAIVGASLIADWIVERADEHAMARALAESITPESALAEAISQLNTEQTAILSRQIIGGIAIVNPDARPVFAIRTPGEDCPLEFAAEILSRVEGGKLPAIRDYSDGSHEREWLQGLTALLVHHGWARPAVGNQAAVLTVPVSEVAYHLGVEG